MSLRPETIDKTIGLFKTQIEHAAEAGHPNASSKMYDHSLKTLKHYEASGMADGRWLSAKVLESLTGEALNWKYFSLGDVRKLEFPPGYEQPNTAINYLFTKSPSSARAAYATIDKEKIERGEIGGVIRSVEPGEVEYVGYLLGKVLELS